MSDISDRILIGSARERGVARFAKWGLVVVPLAAILFQVYVPLFFQFLGYLEFPLLVTVYFGLMRRSQIAGTFIGAFIGLAQDSLSTSHQPVGMYGLTKTLVGYFAASVGMRFDVDHVAVRFILALFFFIFHQFFYWVLARALLGQQWLFDIQQTFFVGLLNAAVGISLYHFLDKLKQRG
jgi:rod shape-determining protein MreD